MKVDTTALRALHYVDKKTFYFPVIFRISTKLSETNEHIVIIEAAVRASHRKRTVYKRSSYDRNSIRIVNEKAR